MAYFYPFGLINSVVSSSFAFTSVTASFSASTNSIAVTASYAQTAQFAPTGPQGTSYSTVCPSGYIPCPNLSVPGYDLVCLQTGSTACGGGETPTCPAAIPGTTTTSTTTTTTTPAPTTTSTTTTTTTPAPTTTSTTTTTTSTTTTSTSTTSTTTTTTAAACVFQYDVTGPFLDAAAACASPDAADFSVSTNNGGITYYGDVGCNTVMATGFYKVDGTSTWVEFNTGTLVNGPTACTTTTTSTTTTGAPGTCYTAVAGGGTSNTVYWTDPTLGPQTTTISGGNKINICSNTAPYESPAADVLFYDCGTSCTTAGTCTDCENATTTTTTSTSTTTTSTTTTTTTAAPVATSVAISDAFLSSATSPSPCTSDTDTTNRTSILLKDQYGNNITNGGSSISVVIRYVRTNTGNNDITLTIPAFQLAGDPITRDYLASYYVEDPPNPSCVNETEVITCVVSVGGGLTATGLSSC